jgi:hypothetical protein
MRKLARSITLAAALVCAGCAVATRAAGPSVTMWRSLGSRQCQGGGTTADALADSLRHSGVEVVSVACGRDGNIRPQLCGIPDDRIAVIELPAAQQALAEAQGFAPIAKLPRWQRVACRPAR